MTIPGRITSSGQRPTRFDLPLLSTQALQFIASDPERLGRFMALTGLDPSTLRQAAAEPGFPLAVLGHLCEDDDLLSRFAAEIGADPAAIGRFVQGETERAAWREP